MYTNNIFYFSASSLFIITTAWKIKKTIIIWEIEITYGKMLMLQFISGWLISFWNLFIYVNNSQYTIYILRNLKDTDNLSPLTPKRVVQNQAIKKQF